MAADALLAVRLPTGPLEPLRLVRPLLHEPDRHEDEERELEELRLPVLEYRTAEGGREHVVRPRKRPAVVGELVGVERVLPGERLADERRQEEDAEEEREPVLGREAPQSTTSPTPIQSASPPRISSQ